MDYLSFKYKPSPLRLLKVTPNVIEGQPWRIESRKGDPKGEIDEPISPDTLVWEIDYINGSRVYLRDWVGSRKHMYLWAERSMDGWHRFKRYRGKPIYW